MTFERFLGCVLSAKKSCHVIVTLSVASRRRARQPSPRQVRISREIGRQLLLVWIYGWTPSTSMQRSDPYTCIICRLPLPISSKRRLINPVTEANAMSTNSLFSMLFLATSFQVTLRNTYANILVSLM